MTMNCGKKRLKKTFDRSTIQIGKDLSLKFEIPELCQCCLTVNNLKNIGNVYTHLGKNEIYSSMLSFVFSEFNCENGYICTSCIEQLRATVDFKKSVESSQRFLLSYKKHNVEEDIKPTLTTVPLSLDDPSVSNVNDHSSDNEDVTDDKNMNMDSEVSDNNSNDFFEVPKPSTQKIFLKKNLDTGELKTLPYVLSNTDRICEFCHKEFGFFKELVDHMHKHYPNYICDTCGKICATRKALVFHVKTHSDIRTHCDFCEKTFKNRSNLNAHVKVHHKGEKILFKCSQCGEMLNTYNARIKHMVEKHGREDKSYKCTQCSCKYRLSSHLRAHIRRVHLQEKKHRCQDCGTSYFFRVDLEKHKLKMCHMISGESSKICETPLFVCIICNNAFDGSEELQEHIKSHSVEMSCKIHSQHQEYLHHA